MPIRVILYWTRLPWGRNRYGWHVLPADDPESGTVLAAFDTNISQERAVAACKAMGFEVEEDRP